MTREEAIDKLVEIQETGEGDHELSHIKADDILSDLLRDLGYDDVVDEFDKIEKWYA